MTSLEPTKVEFSYRAASSFTRFTDVDIQIHEHALSVSYYSAAGIANEVRNGLSLRITTQRNLFDDILASLQFGIGSVLYDDATLLLRTKSLQEWAQIVQNGTSSQFGGIVKLKVIGTVSDANLNLQLPAVLVIRTYFESTLVFRRKLHTKVFILHKCLENKETLEQVKNARAPFVDLDLEVKGLGKVTCRTVSIDAAARDTILWLLEQPKHVVDSFVKYATRKK